MILRAKMRPGKERIVILTDKLFPVETKRLISYAKKKIIFLI